MNGPTYFQSKTGAKRKPVSLPGREDVKEAISIGVQQDSLRKLCQEKPSRAREVKISVSEQFNDWNHKLRSGWNLLFYGCGSKRAVLHKFANELGEDEAVLVVNGWASPANLRLLLQKIISTLRSSSDFKPSSRNGDSRDLLRDIAQGAGHRHLYLIINGLDCPPLRTAEAQTVLSRLAALPQIHLVASIEHVNAPLIWNKHVAAGFNFLSQDLTTLQPYFLETPHCKPLLTITRVESEKQGAAYVLHSLVPAARQIFQILAEHQLQAEEPGMSIQELFKPCRERFLVPNERALRSHLGEFKDHNLVHTKRSADGMELCFVSLDQEAIEAILAEIAPSSSGETSMQ